MQLEGQSTNEAATIRLVCHSLEFGMPDLPRRPAAWLDQLPASGYFEGLDAASLEAGLQQGMELARAEIRAIAEYARARVRIFRGGRNLIDSKRLVSERLPDRSVARCGTIHADGTIGAERWVENQLLKLLAGASGGAVAKSLRAMIASLGLDDKAAAPVAARPAASHARVSDRNCSVEGRRERASPLVLERDNMAGTPEAALGLCMKVWPAAVARARLIIHTDGESAAQVGLVGRF
jgi:hypothetical protein